MKLTGKTRLRSTRSLFGKEKLILQVEYTHKFYAHYRDDNGTDITKWRDAKTEDFEYEL